MCNIHQMAPQTSAPPHQMAPCSINILGDPLGRIKDDGGDSSVAVFSFGPLLNAAADAVALFGTALECSVEQLSCFLCCYWCLLKISCADVFSCSICLGCMDAHLLDAVWFFCRMGSGLVLKLWLPSFADLGSAAGLVWCNGSMLAAPSWCSAYPHSKIYQSPCNLLHGQQNWQSHQLQIAAYQAKNSELTTIGKYVQQTEADKISPTKWTSSAYQEPTAATEPASAATEPAAHASSYLHQVNIPTQQPNQNPKRLILEHQVPAKHRQKTGQQLKSYCYCNITQRQKLIQEHSEQSQEAIRWQWHRKALQFHFIAKATRINHPAASHHQAPPKQNKNAERCKNMPQNGFVDVLGPVPASNAADTAPAADLASLRLISGVVQSEADADPGVVPTSTQINSGVDAVPKNLAPGEALVGCGAPISMDVHTADDKSQHMNLGHAASYLTSAIDHDPNDADPIDPMEMVLPVDQAKEGLSEVGVEATPHDVGTSVRKIGSHSVSDEFSWDRQSCSPASEECSASGQVSSMPAQQMDSDPFQTTFAVCSSDPPGSRSGALSGSTNAEPANVASSFDNPGLDVGTQVVDDLAADYPQRQHTNLVCVQIGAGSMEAPQTSTVELGADSNHQHQVDGSIGIAASAEIGPTPRVDDSTPESIVRITRKYSLADAVDGLLFKAPSDLHDVSSCPLSGDPDMGPEDSGAEVVLPCILESGSVHALPLSLSKQELDNLMPMSQLFLLNCSLLGGYRAELIGFNGPSVCGFCGPDVE
ncbi:hypothetical protein Nepgr_021658 [Nepenthes gracilis]|uniref:Uncharacterized protein n=1 Tax=Nepenthes gracilis TaxID=150966 RepID=A0AAD3T0F2_NEPGR|nr:hypothetical protein Nepgr_021658 [Nepenthes gracilis]